MRLSYVALLLTIVATLAVVMPVYAEAISAGTAPGKVAPATQAFTLGKHYPLGADLGGVFTLGGPWLQPFNGTRPYCEWPDRALVAGRKPAMVRDYVIIGSHRR